MIRNLLTFFLALSLPVMAETPNFYLGTQAIGGREPIPSAQPLLASAQQIAAMGSGIMKFALSKQACFGANKANAKHNPSHLATLTSIAALDPTHRAVLDMPFTHFLIWAYPFATKSSAALFDAAESQNEYREIYDLTVHLLTTYQGTDKSFFLGHWEGDWHLRPQYDPKQALTDEARSNFTAWLTIRQQAIDDAKRDTQHTRVHVWHYTEVNLVTPFLDGSPCLTNSILPHVAVDWVSYSCYDSLSGNIRHNLRVALDHIESKLKPKPGIAGKRVFIGEYGFPAQSHSPEEQNRKSIEVMSAAIEWGCPFVLYWQLFDNEGTKEHPKGFWIIDDKNQKQPIWFTHQRYFVWARKYFADFQQHNARLPSDAEFRRAALKHLLP